MGQISSKPFHGEKLCDSIYRLYQPKGPSQLEVVFVHGLVHDNHEDAYWKTWLARDGTPDNVWPMTWLPDEFSFAEVFALKYDASEMKNATNGRMDLFLVGEKLVQEIVRFGQIGQNGVPVVFVCHGLGGLVAKQIVINAKHHFSQVTEFQKLLKNIGAILFYSTPHHGSYLAKSSSNFWVGGKGPLWENSKVLSNDISRLNQAFEQIAKEYSWIFPSAAETHVTKLYGEMVVEEASSRHEGGNYLALSNDHFDVVRPQTKKDSSYLLLTNCLKEVLDRYAIELAPQVESLVPHSFVRLEVQEKAVKRKLQEASIVGLVGMGGIGKTTLARAMYQSIHKDFERSCYLDDVKSKTSLNEVLITLLQNFGIKDKKTGYIVEQSALQDCKKSLLEDLKTYLKQHRVLVVIDDVGTKENFACLLEDMDFLNGNKESKVIVTCRNWQVVKNYVQESGRYEVEPMRCGEDIELFSYHAFKGARIVEDRHQILLGYLSKDSSEGLVDEFESMCDDVVKACGGLPLSLEVMGCCLGGFLTDGDLSSMECLDCWRGALQKLLRAEPLEGGVDNDRLWKVLQISYDCLHKKEQNMFLDIACFFCDSVQYGEHTLLRIWGGEPSKKVEFRNLKERCLVKINVANGRVTMHDQLRDMGRCVARHQCEGVLSKMTRLWDIKDVSQLLESNEIISPWIQGLSLEDWGIRPMSLMKSKLVGTSKQQMTNTRKVVILDCPALRLLNLHKMEENAIEAINIKGSSSIEWLCLKGINISKLPEFIQVCKKLCVLDMSDCRFLKNLDESIENLVNLLELNLSWCVNLVSLPESLGDMVTLTTLTFHGCERLTSLPDSIGNLIKLSTLDISSCEGLATLPDSIGNLVKLSQFNLQNCERLTSLPDSIGKLVNLSKLNISRCKGLASLPDSIGNLVKLSQLYLKECEGLTSLPDAIGMLVNLSTLDVSGCKGLASLLDSIGNLVKLSVLSLENCEGLTSLPDSIGMLVNLSTLDVSGCKGLASLPDSIGNLVNLSELNISGCKGFTSLPDSIGKLVNLSKLRISDCKGLASLPHSIGNLVKLSVLSLQNCEGLTSLPSSIGTLVNLSTLSVYSCKQLTNLPDSIGMLVNLSLLQVYGSRSELASLPHSIGNLVNLSQLDFENCERLTSLPDSIGNLINLSKLNLYSCKGLASLPDSIDNLVNLSELSIQHCEGLKSLPDSIGKLVNLSKLNISGCKGLTSLPDSIDKLVNLSELHISDCKGLASLPHSFDKLVKLSVLSFKNCEGLTSLPDAIGMLVNLSTLDVSGCKGLASLPDSIDKLVKLSIFSVQNCEGLTSLPDSIGKLVNLLELNISGCKGLTSLPDFIDKLVKLSKLSFRNYEHLTSLPNSIGKLVNLSTLDVYGCKGLESLPHSIGNLVNVSNLSLQNCERLTSLPDSIGNLVNLSNFSLHKCERLTSLPDSIGNLVNLSNFSLQNCERLTSLPDSIGMLVNLFTLDVSCCKGLASLPHSIGNLVKLSLLWLQNCEGLTSLPNSIGKLVNLYTLNVYGCKRLESLPDSIGNLVKLSQLFLQNCEHLTSLPNSIGKLVNLYTLNVYGCKRLESLPDSIGNLVKLSQLFLQNCEHLTSLPDSICKLVNLFAFDNHFICLDLRGCSRWKWTKTSNISLLHKLQQHGCSNIRLPDGRFYHGKYSTMYCSSGQASCDGCGLSPISTKCWHCDICPQFDLCESCYEQRKVLQSPEAEHNGEHPLTAVEVL